MPPEMTMELLDYRVTQLEANQSRFVAATETLILMGSTMETTRSTMQELGKWIESVDKRVQTVEAGHPEDVDARLRALEVAAPLLQLTSNWVILGVLGILGLVGMAGYTIIFKGGA